MGTIPNIVLLYCQQSVVPNFNIAGICDQCKNPIIKTKALPCSSKVEIPHLFKILENGAYGVFIIACQEDKCRFLVGSTRAENRIKYAQGLLSKANINPDRIGLARGQNLSSDDIVGSLKSYSETLSTSDANCLKGALA